MTDICFRSSYSESFEGTPIPPERVRSLPPSDLLLRRRSLPLVLGLDGQSLANVEFATSDGAHPRVCRVLRIVEGGGRLLRYYFAEGGREVQVVLDGTLVPGRLRTTLSGAARRWEIELDAASEPAPEGSPAACQLFDVARASLRE